MAQEREQWNSGWGFLMAAVGSAIGLGNIWKFPYVTGMNGGGAFVLVYLAAVMLVGMPVMIAELAMGRAVRRNPFGAFLELTPKRSIAGLIAGPITMLTGGIMLANGAWGMGTLVLVTGALAFRFGWAVAGVVNGIIAVTLITGYYCVIGGWTLLYAVNSFIVIHPEKEFLTALVTGNGDGLALSIGGMAVFLGLAMFVVSRGVKKGIERCSNILMPVLFVLLLVLILRGVSLPGADKGVKFFLYPDFSKLTADSVILALGQAFYSLSLGMGIIMTYGSYMKPNQSIVRGTFAVILFDTLATVLAGLAIFPALFALNGNPAAGPGLVFQILPETFRQLPAGRLWCGIFFAVLAIAALTSAVSLLEVAVSFLMDHCRMRRPAAVFAAAVPLAILGTLSAMSVAGWERLTGLHALLTTCFGEVPGNFFDLLDTVACVWILPMSGMAIALFTGWAWGARYAMQEIRRSGDDWLDKPLWSLLAGFGGDPAYRDCRGVLTPATIWGVFIRFISPLAIMIAFLHSIGLIKL